MRTETTDEKVKRKCKNQAAYRAKNRNKINAARREKYHTDPEFRKRKLAKQQEWHRAHPARAKQLHDQRTADQMVQNLTRCRGLSATLHVSLSALDEALRTWRRR